jgi:hypothetical protein
MKKFTVLVVLLAAAVGWSQTTIIKFVTKDDLLVPVWEVTGAATGQVNVALSQPSFMAPTTMEAINGWHRYRIIGKVFDVVADGTDQTWIISAGHPGLSEAGFYGAAISLGIALSWGLLDLLTPGNETRGLIVTVSGTAIAVGGVVLYYTMKPTAKRLQ